MFKMMFVTLFRGAWTRQLTKKGVCIAAAQRTCCT